MATLVDPPPGQTAGHIRLKRKRSVLPVLVCAAVIAWGHHRLELLLLVAFLSPLIVIHVGSMALVATCCWGVAIKQVRLFYGGPLCRFNVGGIPIEIGCWPTGGSVDFQYEATAASSIRSYDKLHSWQRLVIILTGPSALLLLGSAMLGGSSFFDAVKRFYPTFLAGTLSPRSEGVNALAVYCGLLKHGNYQAAFGLLAVVMGMLNLLPLPAHNGGMALIELIQMLLRRKLASMALNILQVISLPILLIVAAAWAFALLLLVVFG